MKLVFDFDFLKHEAANIAEERSILVVNKKTGDEYEFSNRTAFWGHHAKKSGGWLAKQNIGRLSPDLPDDFTIQDVQVKKPLSIAYNAVDGRIGRVLSQLSSDDYYGYIGKGDSFRVSRSTVLKYKGQRETLLRALQLQEVEEYILKKHNATIVTGIESDDQCTMDCYADKKLVLVAVDKDAMGTDANVFNPDKMDKPKDCRGLGGLYIDAKKEVRGYGRMFFYHQVLYGDSIDNYKANSASDMKWGDKASYALLAHCKSDKECLEALVAGYKTLYPSHEKIIGWRGYEDAARTILKPDYQRHEIQVDWLYMLRENWDLARMLRFVGDHVDAKDVLTKMGIPLQ